MRAVTLEEIAEATKIGTRSLKALEEEHFDILPGGIFNKGFVRAYARFLGLDQDQAVNDYLVAAGEAQPERANTKEVAQIASQADAARQRRDALLAASGRQSGGGWLVWVALVVLIAAGAGGWKYYEQWKARKAEAQTAAATVVLQATSAPVVAAPVAPTIDANAPLAGIDANAVGTSPAALPASGAATPEKTPAAITTDAATPAEFQVQIHAKEKIWVSVTSDGTLVQKGMLSVDEVRTFAAKSKLVLVSGNPGAVEVEWNGKKQAVPKVSTKSQVLTFTSDGLQP